LTIFEKNHYVDSREVSGADYSNYSHLGEPLWLSGKVEKRRK
jgi:hypothetical protein